VLVALVGASAAPARAESAASSYALQACALAYENSQEHRGSGALSVARSELARCSQSDCPEFIRSDCAQWSKELEAEQPTVVFAAKRSGTDLTEVRVSIGDRLLAEGLPARAIELDPGSYDLQFETPGSSAIVKHVLIRTGYKNVPVQVEFAPGLARPEASPASASVSRMTAASGSHAVPSSDGPGVLPWGLLGLGAASIGAGAGFALWGHESENHLRDTCSPNCPGSEVRPVHTKYVVGDLSVGVGLVSVSVAAYLFLSHRASEQAAPALPVSVVAGPGSASMAYGVRF
jgi:hypothetical protein